MTQKGWVLTGFYEETKGQMINLHRVLSHCSEYRNITAEQSKKLDEIFPLLVAIIRLRHFATEQELYDLVDVKVFGAPPMTIAPETNRNRLVVNQQSALVLNDASFQALAALREALHAQIAQGLEDTRLAKAAAKKKTAAKKKGADIGGGGGRGRGGRGRGRGRGRGVEPNSTDSDDSDEEEEGEVFCALCATLRVNMALGKTCTRKGCKVWCCQCSSACSNFLQNHIDNDDWITDHYRYFFSCIDLRKV